jgi:hypothetical protein
MVVRRRRLLWWPPACARCLTALSGRSDSGRRPLPSLAASVTRQIAFRGAWPTTDAYPAMILPSRADTEASGYLAERWTMASTMPSLQAATVLEGAPAPPTPRSGCSPHAQLLCNVGGAAIRPARFSCCSWTARVRLA